MTKIKCIIIDDEPLAITVIKKHVEQMPQLELLETFQNPLKAFERIKLGGVDLIFLDIHMPVLTGLEFVRALQQPPAVIFTTAYRNYAVESYELDVVDYLVKPITFTRFFKAVNKYLNRSFSDSLSNVKVGTDSANAAPTDAAATPTQQYIYVNANKKHFKVAFDQILYVESIKDYVRIHTTGKNVITKDKISDFEKKLPASFLRIHRSFIVNTEKITAFTAQDVEIGTVEIPIGGNYKEEVMGRLKP